MLAVKSFWHDLGLRGLFKHFRNVDTTFEKSPGAKESSSFVLGLPKYSHTPLFKDRGHLQPYMIPNTPKLKNNLLLPKEKGG